MKGDTQMKLFRDAQITDPKDPLYPLLAKYNVKINRSNSSDAVYVYRKPRGFRLRIGHYIPTGQKHLRNFSENYETSKVSPKIVEEQIKKYLNRF